MGTFKFRCVFCRQKIEAENEWDGMFTECPGCGRRIEIRRDEEFDVQPRAAQLAPEMAESVEVTPPPQPSPSFQKPFPPKNPQKQVPPLPPHLHRRQDAPPPPPPDRTEPPPEQPKEEQQTPPEQPPPRQDGAPKPFPKPFSIELPKWELPPKSKLEK